MQDVRQSQMYARYMQKIGWIVEEIDGIKIFIKKFPLVGSFIKVQRPNRLPSIKLIEKLARKYRSWSVSIELSPGRSPTGSPSRWPNGRWPNGLLEGVCRNNSPYLPTKTIQIDLAVSEEKIFQRFDEAKRRGVRRAIKNRIVIKEVKDVKEFIRLKSKDFWPMQYFMTKDVGVLWESFYPKNATILFAYQIYPGGVHPATPGVLRVLRSDSPGVNDPVAGILLLFYDKIAYYWMAASSNEGKKLFAPTLLVWEALKLSKKRGCKIFDFEGIYDERFHNATKKWQGFSKFKRGFGRKEITFPEPLVWRRMPII